MVLNRIKQFIAYKGIAISAFEKSIGMSNASLGKSLKTGGTIGADKLGNILTAYPEINLYWLVTGKGEMLTSESRDEVEEVRANDKSMPERLLDIIEGQKKQIETLLKMLQEKDEEISRLRAELDARKGGTASDAQASSCASVG